MLCLKCPKSASKHRGIASILDDETVWRNWRRFLNAFHREFFNKWCSKKLSWENSSKTLQLEFRTCAFCNSLCAWFRTITVYNYGFFCVWCLFCYAVLSDLVLQSSRWRRERESWLLYFNCLPAAVRLFVFSIFFVVLWGLWHSQAILIFSCLIARVARPQTWHKNFIGGLMPNACL